MNKSRYVILILVTTITFSSSVYAAGNWWDSQVDQYNNPINSSVITSNTAASNLNTSNIIYSNNSSGAVINYNIKGDGNSNNIRDDVDLVISSLVSQYSFDLKQKRALEQIARSYEYVLMLAPKTTTAAYQVNIRDLAAIRCAEQRLPSSSLDLVSQRIENITLDTPQKRNIYDSYTNLLDENNLGSISNSACEDEFSNVNIGTNINPNPNTNINPINTNINLNVTNSTSSVSSLPSVASLPCLILNQFMESGSSGGQVVKLQTFLTLSGDMLVWPTGYFGGNTAFAVKNFQNKYGIDNSRSWVGPSTRAKVAEITCNGDPSAIASARNGFSVKKYVAPKKVAYKKPAVKPVVKTVSETTTIEIATTTIETSTIFVDNTSLATLSNTSGTFDTKRNPINALYFTVKADTKRDELYVCTESKLNLNCFNQSSYALVRQKYDSATYDSIASNDRWIFNIYYNQNTWGNTGGKIYFRNGTGGVPSVYSISVR